MFSPERAALRDLEGGPFVVGAGRAYLISTSSGSNDTCGCWGFIAFRVVRMIRVISRLRYHLRSAGITYHGAAAVLVVSVASYAPV